MSDNKNYVIPIKGLSQGKHLYEFSVDGDFFKQYGNQYIKDASLDVEVELERGGGWMNVHSNIGGTVTMECDRCLDDVDVPLDINASLAVKFTKLDEHDADDDQFILMDTSEAELDVIQLIYEYVCSNLPVQVVHEDGECNPEMINRLSGKEIKQEDEQHSISPVGDLKQMLENKKEK